MDARPWLAGAIEQQCGPDEWLVTIEDRRLARLDDGRRPGNERMGAEAIVHRVSLGDGWTGIAPPDRLDGISLAWPHLPPRYAAARPAWA